MKKISPLKFRGRKTTAVIFCTLAIMLAISPALVQAIGGGDSPPAGAPGGPPASKSFLERIAYSIVGQLLFGLAFAISYVLGLVVALLSWFLGIILLINTRIIGSPMVQYGYPLTLSIANVIFVVAIIVIAIATIIRSQSYGIKQTLWKLVVMAILVNFGLVIAGTVISFSDGLTLYFLNQVKDPNDTGGITDTFASKLGASFQPQKTLKIGGEDLTDPLAAQELQGTFSTQGNDFGALLKPLAGLFFAVFGLLAMVITLATLNLMLIIRYVYLGILLILLPVAWACWILPSFKNNFDRWWDKFVKQTIFPPIVVFFLYVGMKTATAVFSSDSIFDTAQYRGTGGTWSAVSNVLGPIFTSLAETLLQIAVVVGVMMGGLIAAESLSIKFAGAGIKAFNGAAKGFGSYVGRRTGGRFAREAAGTQPKPRTRVGQALRMMNTAVNPVVWAGKAAGKLGARSNFAERRGWTESLRQYGEKTDFSKPKRTWAKAKDHEKVADDASKLSRGIQDEKVKLKSLENELATTQIQADKDRITRQIAAQKAGIGRLEQAERSMLARAKQTLGIEAGGAGDLAHKAGSESKKLKEQTWEHLRENRGPIASVGLGGLEGAGLWRDKRKLKLSKEQIEELAKASNVSLGGGGTSGGGASSSGGGGTPPPAPAPSPSPGTTP